MAEDSTVIDSNGAVPQAPAPTAQPAATPPTPAPPWYSAAESLKTSDPETWRHFERGIKSGAVTDLPGLVKKTVGLEQKLGITKRPESPDKYDFKKMKEVLGDDNLDEEILSEYRQVLYENAIPQDVVDKLLDLRGKEYAKAKALIEHDAEAEKGKFGEWAKSQGVDSHEAELMAANAMLNRAQAAGADKEQIKTILNVTGLGDAAWMMQAFAELALMTGEGRSMIEGNQPPAGQSDPDYQAAMDIMGNPQNPKHQLYKQNDPNTTAFVNRAFEKIHGSKPVDPNDVLAPRVIR